MLSAIALLFASHTGLEGIAEYFPVVPGSSWVYQEESSTLKVQVEETVADPVEINGAQAYPIIVTRQGREIDRAYYQVGASEVNIVAFDEKKPLLSPYPIIKSPDVSERWDHKGETMMLGGLADMKMTGRAKFAGEETFAGEKIKTLEVRVEATILEEFGTPIQSTQVAVYGKGVGLLRMESTTKHKRTTERSSRKLIAYRLKQN